MLRKVVRQSTESEVTACLTPEVKEKTFQEKGVGNGAIAAGDQRKVTSDKTTNPGLGMQLGASDAQGQEFDLQHSERKQKQTKVAKASSIKVSGLMVSSCVGGAGRVWAFQPNSRGRPHWAEAGWDENQTNCSFKATWMF